MLKSFIGVDYPAPMVYATVRLLLGALKHLENLVEEDQQEKSAQRVRLRRERLRIDPGGICTGVNIYLQLYKPKGQESRLIFWDILETVWRRWSKYSGNALYPVPPTFSQRARGFSALDAFCRCSYGAYYQGEYGELRRELLRFCVDTLQAEANKLRREFKINSGL